MKLQFAGVIKIGFERGFELQQENFTVNCWVCYLMMQIISHWPEAEKLHVLEYKYRLLSLSVHSWFHTKYSHNWNSTEWWSFCHKI